jgi:hypothetical protein
MKKRIEEELAGAYIRGQKVIDAFERWDAKKQRRCFLVDRELDRRREKRARSASNEAASEVNFDTFSQAAE